MILASGVDCGSDSCRLADGWLQAEIRITEEMAAAIIMINLIDWYFK